MSGRRDQATGGFSSLFAVAFLTGPATGLILGRRRNWIGKLTGLAIGSAVGALAVVALAHMVDATGRDPVPVPGEPNRFTFPCGPPDLSGNVTLGWDDSVRGEGGGDNSDHEIRHDLPVDPRIGSHAVSDGVATGSAPAQRAA